MTTKTDRPVPTTPNLTGAARTEAALREARRAAALRANLARRKQQSRTRTDDAATAAGLDTSDTAKDRDI